MLLAISLFAASAAANESADSVSQRLSVEDARLGEKLVRQLWTDIKQNDMSAIK